MRCQTFEPADFETDNNVWHVYPTFGSSHDTSGEEMCWCYPLVEVSWADSSSQTGWQRAPETDVLDCWTAGYLIHRDRNSIVVALNCSSEHSSNAFGDTMTIPASVVRKVRRLR